MGNPPLYPLFEGACRDMLLVQINPVERKGAPRKRRRDPAPAERDFLQLAAAARIARHRVRRPPDRQGVLTNPHYKRILMHRIAMSDSD
jgi:NTE family protein